MIDDSMVAVHKAGLGGSDGAAILGLSKYATPLSVYLEKTGQSSFEGNTLTRMGRWLEPFVIEELRAESKRTIEPIESSMEPLRHHEFPFIIGFPDAILWRDGEVGVLECKTTSPWFRDEWENEPPPSAFVQVHHYMGLRPHYKFGTVAGIVGGELRWADVERESDEYYSNYFGILKRFWDEHVMARNPPAPSRPSDLRYVKDLYTAGGVAPTQAKDSAVRVVSTDEEASTLERAMRTLDEAKQYTARAKAAAEVAEATIRMLIGDGAGIALPSGDGYLLKSYRRKGYSVGDCTVTRLVKL